MRKAFLTTVLPNTDQPVSWDLCDVRRCLTLWENSHSIRNVGFGHTCLRRDICLTRRCLRHQCVTRLRAKLHGLWALPIISQTATHTSSLLFKTCNFICTHFVLNILQIIIKYYCHFKAYYLLLHIQLLIYMHIQSCLIAKWYLILTLISMVSNIENCGTPYQCGDHRETIISVQGPPPSSSSVSTCAGICSRGGSTKKNTEDGWG